MNAFEIIKPNEKDENKLPNEMEVLQHDVNAFSNCYLTGESFDDLEKIVVGKGTQKGIHFGVDFKLHQDAINKFDSVGQQIQSNSCILQHNLVMYSYVYSISIVGNDETEGLLCKLSIVPISHTFHYPTDMAKGGVPITFKPDAPELKDVKWILKSGDKMDLVKEDNGSYSCDTSVTLDSFKNFIEDGVAILRVEMTVDKEYFEIGEYLNLNLKEANVAPNSSKILESILKGEDVPKSDWILSASEGFPRDFHVHGPVLADSSMILRAAVTSHISIGNEIAMISHENRFIFANLKSKDMNVILTYIYQRRFLLPDFDSVTRIGKVLGLLFRDEMDKFFESWNVDLIKNTKKLDRSETSKTISECVKALICVVCSPQGSLLAAYNVALIVAADAWQMAEAKGKKIKKEKVKKLIGQEWKLIDAILETIEDYKTLVCGVEKTIYIE